jgi:hypothetical protein
LAPLMFKTWLCPWLHITPWLLSLQLSCFFFALFLVIASLHPVFSKRSSLASSNRTAHMIKI